MTLIGAVMSNRPRCATMRFGAISLGHVGWCRPRATNGVAAIVVHRRAFQ